MYLAEEIAANKGCLLSEYSIYADATRGSFIERDWLIAALADTTVVMECGVKSGTMHTVNKAYSVLRQEGFVTIDRRRGAIVSLDVDKTRALAEMKQSLRVVLARASCKNVTRQEVHGLVDEIFSEWEQEE